MTSFEFTVWMKDLSLSQKLVISEWASADSLLGYFNHFVPDHKLGQAFHEKDKGEMKRKVKERPDWLTYRSEMSFRKEVEIQHIEKVLGDH
jgi:hypothetical protein